jgi:replicative DNA helicase
LSRRRAFPAFPKSEGRKDRRPILSDLRESGAIEQDADVVMLLYRESYYEKDTENDETEVIIAKHRNGETGTVKLSFLKEYTKFVNALPVFKNDELI